MVASLFVPARLQTKVSLRRQRFPYQHGRREARQETVMTLEDFRPLPRLFLLGFSYLAWQEGASTTRPASNDVTSLLLAWSEGEPAALDRLMPLVYAQLRQLAHRYMEQERSGHVLQTTALINEAYLRLINSSRVQWEDRAHFFAVCARCMRRILVDSARSRRYLKRGGKARQVSMDAALEIPQEDGPDLVALDEALTNLSALDSRKARVVEFRFFGGLTVDETARVLEVSAETVSRDWKLAKAWLFRALSGETAGGS